MVPMTSLPPFQARLLAARLGAEGILWQLRGETAIYPFAPVEVLVEADEVEHARALLDPVWAQDADRPAAASPMPRRAARDPSHPADAGRRDVAGHRRRAVALALRISHLG